MLTPVINGITLDDAVRWGPIIILTVFGFAMLIWQLIDNTINTSVPMGSLNFKSANIEIYHKITSGTISGIIVVNMKNTTDKLLAFQCIMYGDINGSSINADKDIYNGYFSANEDAKLISALAQNVKPNDETKSIDPTFVGTLRYDIKYKIAGRRGRFFRRTAKTLTIKGFNTPPLTGEPGIRVSKINVIFSESKEE